MQTNGHWDNLPFDIQKEIMNKLYSDSERDKICDKRLVNKAFKYDLTNVQTNCNNCDLEEELSNIDNDDAFLETLYWLEKKDVLSNDLLSKMVKSIAYKGFTRVFKWLKQNEKDCFNKDDLMDHAAKGGKLDTLIWLNENVPSSFTEFLLPMSCRAGCSLDVLEWVLDNKGYLYRDGTFDIDTILWDIIQDCSLDTMKVLVRKCPEWWNECLESSASGSRLDLLEWLYDNSNGYIFSMDLFVSLGEMVCDKEVIEFIYKKQFEGSVEAVCEVYEGYKDACDIEYGFGNENTLSWLFSMYSNEKECELMNRQIHIEKKECELRRRELELKKREAESNVIDRNLNITLLKKVVANLSK